MSKDKVLFDLEDPDYESLLDDLYSLQESLLKDKPDVEVDLPDLDSGDDIDSLEIPILTETLEKEINNHKEAQQQSTEQQQHLFGKPPEPSGPSEAQINAILDKLVIHFRPKIEKLLRDKLRQKVIERFQQDK